MVAIPFLPSKKLISPFFKFMGLEINSFLIESFFQRVLFVIAISIPFDIRDFLHDEIKTLPNRN